MCQAIRNAVAGKLRSSGSNFMFQTHTYDDPDVLPAKARNSWVFMESYAQKLVTA